MSINDKHEIYFSSCAADADGYPNTFYIPELSGVTNRVSAEKIIAPFVLIQLELFNSMLDKL